MLVMLRKTLRSSLLILAATVSLLLVVAVLFAGTGGAIVAAHVVPNWDDVTVVVSRPCLGASVNAVLLGASLLQFAVALHPERTVLPVLGLLGVAPATGLLIRAGLHLAVCQPFELVHVTIHHVDLVLPALSILPLALRHSLGVLETLPKVLDVLLLALALGLEDAVVLVVYPVVLLQLSQLLLNFGVNGSRWRRRVPECSLERSSSPLPPPPSRP